MSHVLYALKKIIVLFEITAFWLENSSEGGDLRCQHTWYIMIYYEFFVYLYTTTGSI